AIRILAPSHLVTCAGPAHTEALCCCTWFLALLSLDAPHTTVAGTLHSPVPPSTAPFAPPRTMHDRRHIHTFTLICTRTHGHASLPPHACACTHIPPLHCSLVGTSAVPLHSGYVHVPRHRL